MMFPHPLLFLKGLGAGVILLPLVGRIAAQTSAFSPDQWRYEQTLDVRAAGLSRVDLPLATLDVSRPALEDMRIVDAAGNEVPFLIERPAPQSETRQRAKSFHASLGADATTIVLETGMTGPARGVTLESPAKEFIKSVRVEGSHDKENWQQLASGVPIFRQPSGAAKLRVEIAPAVWEFLRLTMDDRRSEAVPFTGAQVHREETSAPEEPAAVTIKSRDESPGLSRLVLDLGGANLRLATLKFQTSERLFTRLVTVAVPEVTEEGIREQRVADGTVHRLDVEGTTSEHLDVRVEKQIRSRELLVLIHNHDSPPLAIAAVNATRRPTQLLFRAREPGPFKIFTGNSQCAAPHYDVAALSEWLTRAVAQDVKPSSLAGNTRYRVSETLPGIAESGSALDLSDWKYRKPVHVAQPGVQQLELDLEVLSHATSGLADLRLVRDGQQVPYLLERTSISRPLTPMVTLANDPKKPQLSRWSFKLPHPALPVTRLACNSATPLFQREMRLWEEASDERGGKYPRELCRATWRRTPGRPVADLVLTLNQTPLTETMLLETDNGDNPPIEISNVRAFYPVTRLCFKAPPGAEQRLELFYGNRKAAAPRYDLSLITTQLLAAEKRIAALAPQSAAIKSIWPEAASMTVPRRILFWGVLAVVVAVLLTVLAKLLPKASNIPPA
ncbi:MAG: DUF3999 family protein [Verrucomicrobiales bacterium]